MGSGKLARRSGATVAVKELENLEEASPIHIDHVIPRYRRNFFFYGRKWAGAKKDLRKFRCLGRDLDLGI